MKSFQLVLLTICLGYYNVCRAQDRAIDIKKTTNPEKIKIEKNIAPKYFLIGADLKDYKYSEPGFVSHVGLLYGLWGEWYWTSAIGEGKLYGNFIFGSLSYDGALCDLSNKCSAYTSKTNDIIAKINTRLQRNLNNNIYIFAGFGYRYLYDRGEGIGFYTRTGNWAYLPLGANFKFGNIFFELEYDFIIYGNFKSNLSEVSSKFSDLTHAQQGYGLLFTAGYQINDTWSIYSTIEIWNLDESEPVASGGSLFVEPKNSSQSLGLKLGYLF